MLSELSNRQKVLFWSLLGVLAVIFTLMLPGAVSNRYHFGRALTYHQLKQEFEFSRDSIQPDVKELLVARANRSGMIYSVLYTATIAPFFGLLVVMVLHVFSIRTARFLLSLAVGLIALGTILSTGASIQLGPIPGRSVQDGVVGGIGFWILLFILFLGFFGVVSLIKRYKGK